MSNRIEWAETPAFNPMSIDRPRRAGTPPQAPNIGTVPCVRRAVRRRQAEQAAFAAIGSFWAASGAWAGFRRGRSAKRSRNSTCSHTPKRRRWRCTRFGRSIDCFLLLVCLYLDIPIQVSPFFWLLSSLSTTPESHNLMYVQHNKTARAPHPRPSKLRRLKSTLKAAAVEAEVVVGRLVRNGRPRGVLI